MKIQTDHLDPLLQQEKAKEKPKTGPGGFGDVLAGEVDKTEAGVARPAPPPPGSRVGLDPLLNVEATQTDAAPSAEQVMDGIDNVLDKWEQYAANLKTPGAGTELRQAYGVLQTISSDVGTLKDATAALDGKRPDLEGLVDELEVLAVTEQFKFNRGDYT